MPSAPSKNLLLRSPSESNLATIVLDQQLKTLLLTAANTGSGTTTSALALANELARSSRGKVLLIDASLSANNLSNRLGMAEHAGFLDLALSERGSESALSIQQPDDLPFDFMPLGHSRQSGQHLPPESLQQLFQQLDEHYRFVIIDGEAIYANADTLAISALVDGVALVIRAEETRWEVAQAAVQRLNQAGAKVIGSVFNARRYYMPKWIYDYL